MMGTFIVMEFLLPKCMCLTSQPFLSRLLLPGAFRVPLSPVTADWMLGTGCAFQRLTPRIWGYRL